MPGYGTPPYHAGGSTVLKESTPLLAGEVIDSSVMSAKALRAFFEKEIVRLESGHQLMP